MRRDPLAPELHRSWFSSPAALQHPEPNVLAALEGSLAEARGDGAAASEAWERYHAGQESLSRNVDALFGPSLNGRRTRIMVTLSPEASEDHALVDALLSGGVDCVRINCARDNEAGWDCILQAIRQSSARVNRKCKLFMDLAGPKLRIDSVAPRTHAIVRKDDVWYLARCTVPVDTQKEAIIATVSNEALLGGLALGQPVWYDDGKMAGVVCSVSEEAIGIRVTSVKGGRRELAAGRGINLPNNLLKYPALTTKDMRDLPFIAKHADMVGLSFVHDGASVSAVHDELLRSGGEHCGLIVKIETAAAVRNLPELLLGAMQHRCAGALLARGDLAVECGFERLPVIQQQMVLLCEAAHLPLFWATGVLDRYARKGRLDRAEMTDAAAASSADCVMLNRGANAIAALRLLDRLLKESNLATGPGEAHHDTVKDL